MSEPFAIPDALLAVAERALNGYLALDPEGARRFQPLTGRVIGCEITGFGTRITLIPGPDRIQIFGAWEGEPDCLIRGTPLALLRLIGATRQDSELAAGTVTVEGDTALAHDFKRALSGLDVDWEERLARVIGDPLAHQTGEQARAAGRWSARTAESMTANLREYLQEEGRLLPTHYEVETFLRQVDVLRDDTERLAARLDRLEPRHDTGADGPR